MGHLFAGNNDFQNAATGTLLTSSIYTGRNGGGLFVLPNNLSLAAVMFSVRRLIKPTWLNDRDQFLQPSKPLTDEFKSDCLVWMLFNGSNLTAGADGLRWNDRDWSLVNHFIPFTEAEVGAKGRFESDFMVRYMAGLTFQPRRGPFSMRGASCGRVSTRRNSLAKFATNISSVAQTQAGTRIRRSLEAYGDTELTDFAPFRTAYAALTEKLQPQVYEFGFLPT